MVYIHAPLNKPFVSAFCNDNMLVEIGQPSVSPETDIPANGRITFTAQGIDGKIIIVQQSSNHFHRYGEPRAHSHWFVGTGTALTNAVRAEQYQTNIILGCFLTLAFLFVLLFFTHIQNRATLYFSFFCLVWFARVGVTGNNIFSVLFPKTDWFVFLRVQYFSIPALAVLTLAIINALFPKILHKSVLYFLYGISGVFAALFFFTETLQMSHLMDWVYKIYGPAIVYVIACLIIRQFFLLRKINQSQIIFIVGLVIFFLAVLADFGLLPEAEFMPKYHFTGVAMLVFALCEASAIFIIAMREREEMIETRHRLSADVAVLENLSQRKNEYYLSIQTQIEETKRAEHDLRQHLLTIQSYAAEGENESLAEYLSNYMESLPEYTKINFCENFAVNSILQYYFNIAKKENIQVDARLHVPKNTNISDTDLCIIFGNCVENAIEACRKLHAGKFIKIRSVITGNLFTIAIANSFDGIINKDGDKFMSRKHKGEGIGISSVKAVVKKYGESVRFESTENEFRITIILCVA